MNIPNSRPRLFEDGSYFQEIWIALDRAAKPSLKGGSLTGEFSRYFGSDISDRKGDKPTSMTKKKAQPPMLSDPRGESPLIDDTVRPGFYESVAEILRTARKNAYRSANVIMVAAYWNIGWRIVEEEQQGKERAEYGKYLIRDLAIRLQKEFGKGFTESNLRYFRMFYLAYPGDAGRSIRHALRDELSWTHYRLLLGVEKPEARTWYMNEAADQNWSTRALERQINSLYYKRLLMSRDKAPGPDDNPTVGIILCTEKDRTIVKYSVLKENRRLFAAKYKLCLPTEEELQKELEREREWFIRERAVPYLT